jgi:hypothetical protein
MPPQAFGFLSPTRHCIAPLPPNARKTAAAHIAVVAPLHFPGGSAAALLIAAFPSLRIHPGAVFPGWEKRPCRGRRP